MPRATRFDSLTVHNGSVQNRFDMKFRPACQEHLFAISAVITADLWMEVFA